MKKAAFLAMVTAVLLFYFPVSVVNVSAVSEIEPLARYDFSDAGNLGKMLRITVITWGQTSRKRMATDKNGGTIK